MKRRINELCARAFHGYAPGTAIATDVELMSTVLMLSPTLSMDLLQELRADAAIVDEQSIELQSTDPPLTLLLLYGVTVLRRPIVKDEQANPASILVLLYGDEHTAQRDSPVSEAAAAWLPHRRALIPCWIVQWSAQSIEGKGKILLK
nr:hypothetical protein Iba_chr05aCG8760 [Ipomoea batatas]